ncbi:MAG TPA: hypothetical protein VF678_03860 [bacterium]
MGNLSSVTFPPGTSRYTQAMAKCLAQVPAKSSTPDRAVVHLLMNLVQGRMLEYLADQICHDYGIEDEQSKFQIVTALLHIFSDEFFALFRSKIDEDPTLVVDIARRIIRKEAEHPTFVLGQQWADRLYPAIFRKYFEYRNLQELQHMVESDAEIQKIILLAMLRRTLEEGPRYDQVVRILEQDREGFTTAHFMEQVKNGKVAELLASVESGHWQSEVASMRDRVAHLRGE